METSTSPPKTTERFDLEVHLLRILFGFVPFLVLASPFLVGLASFEIARIWGSQIPLIWGKRTGFGCLGFFLTILPVYMLGKALQLSRIKAGVPVASSDLPTAGVGEKEINDQIIDIWKISVDVQQHFNDLELRIRNFAVTLLVAIVGATAFSLKERYAVQLGGISFPLAAAVLCAGIIGWLAFYFMDMHWYHRLLLGSVKHSVSIEKDFSVNMPELGLSRAIGKESPWLLWGKFKIHSSEKITLFYAAGLAVLAILTLMILFATPSTPQESPVAPAYAPAVRKSAVDANVPDSPATTHVQSRPKNEAANTSPVNK